ncbi:MAG TPA: serine hydrolase domain-containing protein, partial [Planctomycetaceae bacterium]
EPGTRWRYSNAGYVLLGAILEKAAGRGYEEVIAEQVFEPAGMRDSGFFSPEDEAPNRAVGYTRMGLDGKPLPGTAPQPIRHGRGGPAGGVWSTAEDLLRFSEALRTHALLDAETTAAATSMRAESGMGPGAGYGYGFETQNINGARVFGHYGGFPGVSAGLEVYPDLGYTVVILSNTDMGGQRVVGRIHDWLTSH